MMSWFDHDFVANDSGANLTSARDIEKKDTTYVVTVDMPGLRKKDIHLELNNGMLTVRGELHERHEEKTGGHQRNERIFGSIEQKFRVPEGVTENDIHTQYKNGVLELTIPASGHKIPKSLK
jgi:HSP20 family protein